MGCDQVLMFSWAFSSLSILADVTERRPFNGSPICNSYGSESRHLLEAVVQYC